MITEDYVSFETAKLLKAKGFTEGEDCFGFYDKKGSIHFCQTFGDISDYDEDTCIDAPTLQMAMRWLRDVHHIVLVVDYDYECTDKSYCYKVYCLGENGKPKRVPIYGARYDIEGNQSIDIVSYRDYERSRFEYVKYEEACEAGIKYCLENLI